MSLLTAPILLVGAAAIAWAIARRPGTMPLLPAAMAVGWFGVVMLEGGSLTMALVGLAALLPLAGGGDAASGRAVLLRLAAYAGAAVLLALTHADRLTTADDIAFLAAIAVAMLAFVLRGPETNRIAGIEGAHLAIVAIGIAVVAVDAQRAGAALDLPALLAGLMIGTLLAMRPAASAALGRASADGAAILVAVLLGDLALSGAWAPAAILAAIAALEIVVWLHTAARADRSNEKDQPRGAFVEGERRDRGQRRMVAGVIVAGAILVVLALGAAQGEWIAGLLGAAALMWLFQRFLWRLVPERRLR